MAHGYVPRKLSLRLPVARAPWCMLKHHKPANFALVSVALMTLGALLAPLQAVSNCDFSTSGAVMVKETKLKDGIVKLGTLQVSKKNQNPIVAFFQNDKQVFCRKDLDATPVDARAIAVTADKEHLFVAFSTDGGSSNPIAFRRFTKNGWQKSYGNGGGAKVIVLLKILKTDGEVVGGTYVTARKDDGKTNSIIVKKLTYENNSVQLQADSWYSPLRIDQTPYSCSGKSPFFYTLQLSPDLATAMSSNAPQCK